MDGQSLREAQRWLDAQLEEGVICPCCDQYAKRYRRSLYGTLARALVLYSRLGGVTEFVHVNRLKKLGHIGQGDASWLSRWGLMEEESKRRQDGGKSGYWKVTDLGYRFIRGLVEVPRYIWMYNGEVVDSSTETICITDVLGTKFSYEELMHGDNEQEDDS